MRGGEESGRQKGTGTEGKHQCRQFFACYSLVSNEFQLTMGSEAIEKCKGKDVVLPLVSKCGALTPCPFPHSLFHSCLCELTSRSLLGLGHLYLVSKTNFRPNCEGHIKISHRRDDVSWRSLRRSRSFKVTNSDTNRKPVYDFQVNNTKVNPYILSRTVFQSSRSIRQIIASDRDASR